MVPTALRAEQTGHVSRKDEHRFVGLDACAREVAAGPGLTQSFGFDLDNLIEGDRHRGGLAWIHGGQILPSGRQCGGGDSDLGSLGLNLK